MSTTALSSTLPATGIHRVTGSVDQAEAAQGALAALGIVERLARAHGPLALVLDLRDKHFADLQAHRAWSQGFARNPALQDIIHAVAIVDDDTPTFRKEDRAMPTTDDLATLLLAAQARAALVEPPSASDPAFDLPAAYAVGAAITARRRARGERSVGRKIGFTNAGIWQEYGVDAPLWAHVYDTTLHGTSAGSARLALAGMAAPRIEPELVLGLRAAPPADAPTPAGLLPAIGWVALGFELVDCHFADWRFTLADAVADFGLHAALVVGAPLPLESGREAGLVEALAGCTLTLDRDGEPIATGVGANALGSPLRALGHLVRTLAAQGAEPLAAGEVVTTGTITPAFPVRPGETWTATVAGLAVAPLRLELA